VPLRSTSLVCTLVLESNIEDTEDAQRRVLGGTPSAWCHPAERFPTPKPA